jgi:hypothetical protein
MRDMPFEPPVMRYTVRTPEARHEALKASAKRVGMTPGQLVQALFDQIDLTRIEGDVMAAKRHFDRLYPAKATTKELAARAASCGLTVSQLKIFRALSAVAGDLRIVTPSAGDIAARSGLGEHLHDELYDQLIATGFIALHAANRGRRVFTICRIPEL